MGRLGQRWWALAGGFAAAMLVSAAGQAADLLFQAEGQSLAATCTGQAVRLEGNHNTVSLSGTCGSLLLKGVANTVRLPVAPGGAIRVEGSENRVHFLVQGAAPIVSTFGPDNDVSSDDGPHPAAVVPSPAPHPTPVAPATAVRPLPAIPPPATNAPLRLAGDDEERLADCGGRDVVVVGSRSSYVVRGECRSLEVRGDLLTVQAVMRAGARIAVAGRGSVVSWAVPGRGRAPASVVRGAGSRVQRAEAIGGQPVR